MDKAAIIKVLSDAYDEGLTAHHLNENSWAKAIAMMRHGFGGHPFGEDDHIKKRAEGQIEDFYINDKN
jgi:6-phosphogluconate dehydrogenase